MPGVPDAADVTLNAFNSMHIVGNRNDLCSLNVLEYSDNLPHIVTDAYQRKCAPRKKRCNYKDQDSSNGIKLACCYVARYETGVQRG